MKIKEELSLTILYENKSNKKEEKEITKIINFLHSLGIKNEGVCWCDLDLTNPDSLNLLSQIETYAKQHKYVLEGDYYKEYIEGDSDWYSLFPSSAVVYEEGLRTKTTKDRNGEDIDIIELIGFRVPEFTLCSPIYPNLLVTEKFRHACMKHNFTGLDFYWVRDIGKFDAPQYFGIMIENKVDEFVCDRGLEYYFEEENRITAKNRFFEIGGILQRLYNSFAKLDIHLPIYLPEGRMPDTDFAYTNVDDGYVRGDRALIKKNAAEILIAEGILKKEDMRPELMFRTTPSGYVIQKSDTIKYPSDEVVKELLNDYNSHKENPKPKCELL